ncbi:RNA 2',3'-cyclic phosphodiesterase [bacterium]
MIDTIRSFIAVHLSDRVREQIAEFQSGLKRSAADVKWVRPESMHITLKFLGDIAPDQIKSITNIMHELSRPVNSFMLTIRGVGCFPNESRPRVLWLGIQTDNDVLINIGNGLNAALQDIDFEPEKRSFKPHLTLGRVKSQKNIYDVVQQMHAEGFDSEPFCVDTIHLMQSKLKPSGAEHNILKSIQL